MIILLIIIALIFAIISGFSKAICDLSEEQKLKFSNKFFWLKQYSWINKWKTRTGDLNMIPLVDDKGNKIEKFFGSSRWFVALTDAWHLFGLIERIGFFITYTIVGFLISKNAWFFFLLSFYALSMLSFHLFYNSKLLRKW